MTGDRPIPLFAIVHKSQHDLAVPSVEYSGGNLPNLIRSAIEFVAV
jgi:hypothetical protein